MFSTVWDESIYGLTEPGKYALNIGPIGSDDWRITGIYLYITVPHYWEWFDWQPGAPARCISSFNLSINSLKICPNPGDAIIWTNP